MHFLTFVDKYCHAAGLIIRRMTAIRKMSQKTTAAQLLADAFDAHGDQLYRYAVMILADRSTAEDAVQQVFAKLAAQGERISQIASLGGYLARAVRNECYRIIKNRSRSKEVNLEPACIVEAVEDKPVDDDQARLVSAALTSLAAEQREVVHMKIYRNRTFQQIADELSISINDQD